MERGDVEQAGVDAAQAPSEETSAVATSRPICFFKSTEGMIPTGGGIIHVSACALNFAKNSFLKETEVKLNLSTDVKRWPVGYAAIAPMLDIISSGELQLPVAIGMRAWCSNGNLAKVKNAMVVALHFSSEDGGWEKLAEFPFGDEIGYELQCVTFSPIFLGVLEQHIVHATMTAEAVIFVDNFNNYLIMLIPALHCHTEMDRQREAGMRVLVQYSTVVIAMDEEFEISITPTKEGFKFTSGGKMTLKIDKNFLKMQIAHGRVVSLESDAKSDRRVGFLCDIKKDGKGLDDTQGTSTYWRYLGETKESPGESG